MDAIDYIAFYLEGDSHLDDTQDTITWNPPNQFTYITTSFMDFKNSDMTDLTLSQPDTGMYKITSSMGYFELTGMNNNMKQVLSFYYVSDGETLQASIAYTLSSGTTSSYKIEAKVIGYVNFALFCFFDM